MTSTWAGPNSCNASRMAWIDSARASSMKPHVFTRMCEAVSGLSTMLTPEAARSAASVCESASFLGQPRVWMYAPSRAFNGLCHSLDALEARVAQDEITIRLRHFHKTTVDIQSHRRRIPDTQPDASVRGVGETFSLRQRARVKGPPGGGLFPHHDPTTVLDGIDHQIEFVRVRVGGRDFRRARRHRDHHAGYALVGRRPCAHRIADATRRSRRGRGDALRVDHRRLLSPVAEGDGQHRENDQSHDRDYHVVGLRPPSSGARACRPRQTAHLTVPVARRRDPLGGLVLSNEYIRIQAEVRGICTQEGPDEGASGEYLEVVVFERLQILRPNLQGVFHILERKALADPGFAQRIADLEHASDRSLVR